MKTTVQYRPLDIDRYVASTALELGQKVAAGIYSPVQLAELALEHARAAEPTINAYAKFLDERVLGEAAEREAEVRQGWTRSPLHGVPVAVKDNFLYAGEVTGKGSLTVAEQPASTSSPMVQRLVGAGMCVIGKTTTPEFGWKGTGNSPRTGVTRNPRNPDLNTGGSSAGSAATLAAGAVPVAIGTDAGGSIRIPAAFCGVVGFKPTLSAVPVWPGTVNENLSHAGPMTRSVADARAVFMQTRGFDPRDPQSAFVDHSSRPISRGCTVGVVSSPFGVEPEPPVAEAFESAVGRLRASGVGNFTDFELPGPPPREIFEALWVTGRGLGFADVIARQRAVMDPGLARLHELAGDYSLADYFAALGARRAFNVRMFELFGKVDLLLMPTMSLLPFAATAEVPPGGEVDAPLPWVTWTPYTYAFNITGQPAIGIPYRSAPEQLPIGLQIVGPWSADSRVLAFAESCETVLGRVPATVCGR